MNWQSFIYLLLFYINIPDVKIVNGQIIRDEGASISFPPSTPLGELNEKCSTNEFRCNDGSCIPDGWKCDYQLDCKEGEDEQQDCAPPQCGDGKLTCANYQWNKTYCYDHYKQCDKVKDCEDNSDEHGCTYRECLKEDHRCKSGLCIATNLKCNGYYDCRDESDEADCNNKKACTYSKFRCEEKCIDKSQKCDHRKDCLDNSDEKDCDFPACHEDQFRCESALCIPKRWHCDGPKDCLDGSDEDNCTVIACPDHKFLCEEDKRCIAKEKQCDGTPDCSDGSDEQIACSEHFCPGLGCQFNCRSSPSDGECYCEQGKKVSNDSTSCIDKDECDEWGYCDQKCINTDGSFKCQCVDGYRLDSNQQKCVAINESNGNDKMVLYFAYHDKIYNITEDTIPSAKSVTNTMSASGLDYHYKKGMLYWSDIESRKIYFQPLNSPGNDSKSITSISLPGTITPGALAIDWISDKLYVVDTMGQKIDIFGLGSSRQQMHAIVLSSNITEPRDIALDPTKGLMFVADTARIVRANMDGSNIQTLVKEVINKATGIAVDLVSQRLYWCDSLLDYIETIKYDGTGRIAVVRGPSQVPAPNRLTVFERQVYWTDSTKNRVMRIDKFNGTQTQTVIYEAKESNKDPKGIKAIHKLLQPSVSNPCGIKNGDCEQLCIITAVTNGIGYICACKIGYTLGSDQKTCTMVNDFLIYSQKKFIKGQVLEPVSQNFNDAIDPIVSKAATIVGLDFDAESTYIYYSDVILDVIYRVKRIGTGRQTLLASQNEEGVEGLALDWASKNLYYTDSRKGTLNVLYTEVPSQRKVLLKNLNRPRAIVVHPNKGYVFFSEWDRPANISRAHLDGTNVMVFRNVLLGWPNGLSIDYLTDRIYWCDALLDHVQYANLDGTDVKTISSPGIRHPFSLVIFKEWLYVTDWRLDAILRMNKTDGSSERVVAEVEESSRLYGIKIYSTQAQKIVDKHPCRNREVCDKFCFPVPDNSTGGLKAVCDCPQGEKLNSDGKTCFEDPDAVKDQPSCPPGDLTCANGNDSFVK